MSRQLLGVLILLLLVGGGSGQAAPVELPGGWTGEVTVDAIRLPTVRFLQVRLVHEGRGWTIVEQRDVPTYVTTPMILDWAKARVAWYDQMYVAYLDLRDNRIGQTLTQGDWQVTIMGVDATLKPPAIAVELRLTYTPLVISALGAYTITDPSDYTWEAFLGWAKEWATACAAKYLAAMAPVAQAELDKAVTK